jgi:hypothetical protein
VVVIVSGGNVDLTRMPEFLSQAKPIPGV